MHHEVKQAEQRIARRQKKKHPNMKVSGVGTKKLAARLTKSR
ncbi:MAG: hypothetical protein AAB865_01765 [Patescibacteria group bacterium]